jgi:hypothetical protein
VRIDYDEAFALKQTDPSWPASQFFVKCDWLIADLKLSANSSSRSAIWGSSIVILTLHPLPKVSPTDSAFDQIISLSLLIYEIS